MITLCIMQHGCMSFVHGQMDCKHYQTPTKLIYSLWSKTIVMLWGLGITFQANTQFTPKQACSIENSMMNTFAYAIYVQFYDLDIDLLY